MLREGWVYHGSDPLARHVLRFDILSLNADRGRAGGRTYGRQFKRAEATRLSRIGVGGGRSGQSYTKRFCHAQRVIYDALIR
jgi:hypothetical protein